MRDADEFTRVRAVLLVWVGGAAGTRRAENRGAVGGAVNASLTVMLRQCEGLIDTVDVTEWENEFLRDVAERWHAEKERTVWMSGKQIQVLERIWKKHFAA